MPMLTCRCGEGISLSEFPNDNEYPLFSDAQLEELQNSLASICEGATNDSQRQRNISQVFSSRHPKPEIIECPKCGRLALFGDMSDEEPLIWYLPELKCPSGSDRIRDLFSSNDATRSS